MTMIGSPACPLGRLEGQARGGGEGEGRCRLSSPPPKGATPCDRPPRGAILIPRPLGVVDYSERLRRPTPAVDRRRSRARATDLALGQPDDPIRFPPDRPLRTADADRKQHRGWDRLLPLGRHLLGGGDEGQLRPATDTGIPQVTSGSPDFTH